MNEQISHAGYRLVVRTATAVVLALALATTATAKPKVTILATGGTIAGAQASQAEYGYQAGAFKVEDLINAVPQMKELADINGEQIVNIGSQDMNDEVWLKLGKRVNEVLQSTDAVVITHGTDTMEETSYFLNLVVKSDKPVVLVGSMRPATGISADGPMNLYNAVAVAADPNAKGRGVLVAINDTVHAARNVVKVNTSNVEAFRSPNRGPAAIVNTGKITWLEVPGGRRGAKSEFSIDGVTALPRVDIIYAHANMSADLIDAAVANGARGIVLAGVGDGNATTAAIDKLTATAKKGVVVVRSTRVPSGLTYRNNEVNDDKLGFVASLELNPAKSRVLLQQALRVTKDPQAIQRMFAEY
ncbi:MAG: type II asparaginase [Gammaproteobacteria bacterium]|nr:type II asparaginase [Gammaproteobacteria bacterium]